MKTEISRDSHQPQKCYSGVYQQQGRMLTDADWNELVDILKSHLNDALKDIVGNKVSSTGGTPRHRALKVKKDSATDSLSIQPGHIYIDGVSAQVPGINDIPYIEQNDFPLSLPPTGDCILYADAWERTVTHLMDERLRDKGLHGADTCSRTQMMAQIKWCPLNMDPEQSSKNPAKGDAGITVKLLRKTNRPDACDPCADMLPVNSKTGNYLFRFEVHDVEGDADKPTKIILKWSSENGAEQYTLKNGNGDYVDPPESFKSSAWTFEFFDEVTEKHMGVHLASGFSPSRETLINGYPSPIPSRDFVRRWDGYCVLTNNGGNWSISKDSQGKIKGMDRGVALQDTNSGALGYINIMTGDNGLTSLVINLTNTEITLSLTKDSSGSISSCSFVAGDYWLAEVREIEHTAGSILIDKTRPAGITHHYLILGKVTGDTLDDNPETDRKYSFPPLTEMTRMFIAGGDGQEIMPGEPLPQPLRVGVSNGEWPVEGAMVRFTIENGGGTLNPANNWKTGSDGIAECTWTPGSIDLNPPDPWPEFTVKATLVDPDDPAADLVHPPVYFHASLVSADQVAYCSDCPDSAENTVHSHLAENTSLDLADGYHTVKEVLDALLCNLEAKYIPYNDSDCSTSAVTVKSLLSEIGLDFDNDNRITVGDILDTLLCKLRAGHIPYDPTNFSRWNDINAEESPGTSPPDTVQKAIDALLENLHSEDIKYPLPVCDPAANTLKSHIEASINNKISEGGKVYTRISDLWNALLCHLDASKLPLDTTDPDLCSDLKAVDTVQEALKVLCDRPTGGGCLVTVGEGGIYPDLKTAFEKLKDETQVNICLLPHTKEGTHFIENGENLSGKQSISIIGHNTLVALQGEFALEADNIAMRGIHFAAINEKAEQEQCIILSSGGGNIEVEHCRFYRNLDTDVKKSQPFVSVNSIKDIVRLHWHGNYMETSRIDKNVIDAVLPKKEGLTGKILEAFDAMETVLKASPYDETTAFESKVNKAAEKIIVLTGQERTQYYDARDVGRINKLPDAEVDISRPRAPVLRVGSAPVPREPVIRSVTIIKLKPKTGVNELFEDIKSVNPEDIDRLKDRIKVVAEYISRPDDALSLNSCSVWGDISCNTINGHIYLLNIQKERAGTELNWGSTDNPESLNRKVSWAKETSFLDSAGALNLHNNMIFSVNSMVSGEMLENFIKLLTPGADAPKNIKFTGYASLSILNNIFGSVANSFISKSMRFSGNEFPSGDKRGEVVAYAMGYYIIFTGNLAPNDNVVIEQVSKNIRKAEDTNILRII